MLSATHACMIAYACEDLTVRGPWPWAAPCVALLQDVKIPCRAAAVTSGSVARRSVQYRGPLHNAPNAEEERGPTALIGQQLALTNQVGSAAVHRLTRLESLLTVAQGCLDCVASLLRTSSSAYLLHEVAASNRGSIAAIWQQHSC
eukprot:6185477-Pleurochrysis_carterae.AAC.1